MKFTHLKSLLMVFTVCTVTSLALSQTTLQIVGDGSDVQLYDNGQTVWVGQKDHAVGRSHNSYGITDSVSIFVFELPALSPDDEITGANLDFNSTGGSWNPPPTNLNLYGLGYQSSVNITIDDFFQGEFGSDTTNATPIQQDFGISWPAGDPTSANGTYSTDDTGDAALLNYITSQYASGAVGGDYVLLRLNVEEPQTNANLWKVGSGNNDNPPVLTIILNGASPDEMPQANAGADQNVRDNDNNGSETVTLDGSASSDPDGILVSYIWTENEIQIATGISPSVSLALGTHTIVLTVTDDSGYSDSDTIVVSVLDPAVNAPPTANAGSDQNIIDLDGNGSEDITLDASASTDTDGTIISYIWISDDTQIATGITPTVSLSTTTHTITLTVTDDSGASDTDTVTITIEAPVVSPLPQPDPDFIPPTPPDPNGNQLLNLYGQNIVRPETFERTWPSQAGQADICLYEDDKFAAINICVDDNTAPDHQWWRDMCELHNIKISWMVVVDALSEYSGNSFYGSWPEFRSLYADGFNVQSHSMTHQPNDDEREDYLIHYEYAMSKQMIEQEIPGNKVLTIAYPYGKGKPEIAALYYMAARGTTGTPNKHNQIDYMQVHSGGNIRDNVDVLLTGSSSIPWHNSSSLRGWMSHTIHYIQPADKPAMEADVAYAASKQDQLWIGTFEDIAMYGQERDTAVLTVTQADQYKISFTLTDRMMDSIFTYPLTIKVHLFDSWNSVSAIQAGNPLETAIIEHDGEKYALVKAVPDAGEVIITPGNISIPGDADLDEDVDILDFLILKSNYSMTSGASWSQGDFDLDGDVDIYDFLILKANYGTAKPVQQTTYYVDYDNGSDTNSGISALYAWKHCPGDKNATDNASSAALVGGDTIIFKGGVSYRGEIVCQWSGDDGNPIIYDGNSDGTWGTGRAIIDGSQEITGWTQCQNADEADGNQNYANIYWTYAKAGATAFNTDFFQGETRLHPAQDPNLSDPFYFDNLQDWVTFDSYTDTAIVDSNYFTQSDPAYWDGSTYIYIHGGNNAALRKAVTGYDPLSSEIQFESLSTTAYESFAMVNSLKILDVPGELVVREDQTDASSRPKVYIWPTGDSVTGETLTTAVEKGSFNLGDESHITIQGFHLSKSISNYKGGIYNTVNAGITDIAIDNNLISHHSDSGIAIDEASNCTVSNNEVTRCRGRGIILSDVDNCSIEYNWVHEGGETAIDYYTAIDSQIIGNIVQDNRGIHANGITCYIYCENILIYGNKVTGGNVACTVGDCEKITIAYNLLDGNGANYAFADWRNQNGLYLYNNVIINGGSTVSTTSTDVIAKNNIMSGSTIAYQGGLCENNIYTELSWTQDSNNLGTGEFVAEPAEIWIDPDNGNYHLKSTSPAIDAGADVGQNFDIDGNAVPNGNSTDIGIFEY